MKSDPRQSAEQVFSEALAISGAVARNAFLDQACAGDPALRQEVDSLLTAHEQAGQFLQPKVALSLANAPVERPGDRIGRYKLLEQIGEGGFGVVWMAEQEEPVRRRVALKIIKLGMDTREVVARFEAERQALAMMDHPNIAIVFDGGATDTGRPYFVMELVKGVPITDYCDANKLSTRERLELFMQVCQAVQHAHQKGVIHRDLKPTNILVTVKDDRPVPKVIDFGVAKATQARLTEKTLFTRFQQWIGTPAYMSPEQAGLGSLDVDTRSDIYSLGVLLYELLTGRPPFDTQKLLAAGYEAVMRTIREQEPPKPSTRLSTLANEELNAVAVKRGTEPVRLGRLVRGDLDWIVMKALEKDRTRRFESASALAQDIMRHLRAEPVSAAAPTFRYRTSRFIRRHRPQLAFAALGCVAVLLAVVGVKLALSSRSAQQAFETASTNAVFTLARSRDAKALSRVLDVNPRLVNEHDAEGSAPLSYSAGAGATNTLRLLITRGAEVDATNHVGLTALGNAAANNQPAALVALLAAGADPNHVDASGVSALHAASLYGSVEMGRALIAKGARLDVVGLGDRVTALQQAAMLGYADFVDLLLGAGASVDVRDSTGATPLHATASGKTAVGSIRDWQEQLVSKAASSRNNQGFAGAVQDATNRLARIELAMLALAVQRGGGQHRRVAELLLAHQADPEAANSNRFTPLLMAAFFTNLPVAEVLVAHKANLNARAQDGSTPLNLVALKGSAPIAELLVKAGAMVNTQDDEGFTPLNTAIEQRHPDVAKVLLAHGADPNGATRTGQTPMHTAAGQGDIEMLSLLLDHGAARHPLENAGTPLSVAVQFDHVEAVKFLLQRGAKPEVAPPQNGMTSLHWAATLGRVNIVRLLLDEGARADSRGVWQGTPLHAAAAGREGAKKFLASLYAQLRPDVKHQHLALGSEADYLAVLRLLLAAKAEVNAPEPRDQRTPIYFAVNQGQAAAVDLLVKAGANSKATDQVGQTPLHAVCELEAPAGVVSNIVTRLLGAGVEVDARDQRRGTPLHAAANAGKPVMAALLLQAGAAVNAVGPNNCTPLQLAVLGGYRNVVEELLRKQPILDLRNYGGTTALHQAAFLWAIDLATLLVEHGADVNAPTIGQTNNGITALMVTAKNGDLDMMKLLLDHSAKLEITNDAGFTALNVAVDEGHLDAAKFLLDRGAKPDAADRLGNTPAMTAAKRGKLEMLKLLLRRGAALDDRDQGGFTLLHGAADHGHAEVVEFLLGRGLDANLRSDSGYTPLHAAANGYFTNEASEIVYVGVIQVLLAHNAEVNARMQGGQTPLHRAATWGRPKIVEALLAARANPSIRDSDGKTALDLATANEKPGLPPAMAAGRKECADLLRNPPPVQTPDAKVHKPSQSPNPPPAEPKP